MEKLNTLYMEESGVPSYMIYPRFLLELEDLSDADRAVYVQLLDRSRLSMKHAEKWTDEEGHVYLIFTYKELAQKLHRSQSAVKRALHNLDEVGLIERSRRGVHQANHIYVKLPAGQDGPTAWTEADPSNGPVPTVPDGQNGSTSKKDRSGKTKVNVTSKAAGGWNYFPASIKADERTYDYEGDDSL